MALDSALLLPRRVMGRDHRKLVVFSLADRLVTEAYAVSQGFPVRTAFGLRTTREYLSFLNIAAGSAA